MSGRGPDAQGPQRGTPGGRAERERRYHNRRYARHAREGLGRFYKVVRGAWARQDRRVLQWGSGKKILEYGCGEGVHALECARFAREVTGIDISDYAIRQAAKDARRQGVRNCRFRVMDAERTDFPDGSFDLVVGSGILHHLSLEKALAEIRRLLREGGLAIFVEPLGHNPLINWYRRRTPEARTRDEHPFRHGDLKLLRRYFRQAVLGYYGLATLAAIPLIDTPFLGPVLGAAEAADGVMTRVPGLQLLSWVVYMELHK